MKGNKTIRLAALLLVTMLAASVFGMHAFAEDIRACKICGDTVFTPTKEFEKVSQTECVRLYKCSNDHKQPTYYTDGRYRDKNSHAPIKNATCMEAAVCGNCGEHFGAPLDHIIVVDQAVAATCKKTGLTEGSHCSRCGQVLLAQEKTEKAKHSYDKGVVTKPTCSSEGYTTYTCQVCGHKKVTDKVKQLSHWYDLWAPAGNGQNSAPCKREGCTYIKTTACVDWDFLLLPAGAEKAEQYSVCPVCGMVSDGSRLALLEEATVHPITGWTPEGDMVFRMGELENGEKLICIGFEFDARLVTCTGYTEFTVPTELVEGYELMLLESDGTETPLETKTSAGGTTFMLSYYGNAQRVRTPVRLIHLVPVTE